MPKPKTVHKSTFDSIGYIHRINISSGFSISSGQQPVLPVFIESGTEYRSDAITENHTVFHQSAFSFLIERNISPKSGTLFKSDATHKISIKLKPTSRITIRSGIDVSYGVVSSDKVWFGPVTFKFARRISDDSITIISDSKAVESVVDEPLAFRRMIHILAETDSRTEHDTLFELIGKKYPLSVYGTYFPNCRIANISDYQIKPKLERFRYLIDFEQVVYNTEDSVKFGNLTLSNPSIPNAIDITPEYGVEITDTFNVNPIPVISQRFAVEGLTESVEEYEALLSLIGSKLPLTINGTEYPFCYITAISGLQPRGGGNIWKYTVVFSKRTGHNPIHVIFDGIALPNATASENENIEIITSRTVLKSGKTAARIGATISHRFAFSCMSNDKTVWDALLSRVSVKSVLSVDGEEYSGMYVSNMLNARTVGAGLARFYTWEVIFEQETI